MFICVLCLESTFPLEGRIKYFEMNWNYLLWSYIYVAEMQCAVWDSLSMLAEMLATWLLMKVWAKVHKNTHIPQWLIKCCVKCRVRLQVVFPECNEVSNNKILRQQGHPENNVMFVWKDKDAVYILLIWEENFKHVTTLFSGLVLFHFQSF